MERGPVVWRVWLPLGLAMALIVALLWQPMWVAWRCYRMHATGERAETEVVKADPQLGLVLRITTGPRRGQHCTADTSAEHLEAARPGDELSVVLPADRPDECVLLGTLERSAALLRAVGAATAALLLGLFWIGLRVQRMFTQRTATTTQLEVDPERMRCPRCAGAMSEGYLPLLAGVHWREPGEPIGLPHALAGLPGTVGWRSRPRLHAYRCEACQIVTFRYGA